MAKAGNCLGYLRHNVNQGGGKYVHRCVAEEMLGRPLDTTEVVHHEDGNRSNNDPFNLMVFKTNSDHIKHHMGTGELRRLEDGTYIRYVPAKEPKVRIVKVKPIRVERSKYKIEWPDADSIHRLVWSTPTQQIASTLGVTDSAIGKYCKRLGVPKPPKGWWAKLSNGVAGLSCPTPVAPLTN
jgi:hypothetical protein